MTKTKTKHVITWPRLGALVVLGLLIIASIIHPLAAQTVTEGFNSDEALQRGMLVAIRHDDSTKVESVTLANVDRLHGVVVNPNDAPVTLSREGQKVFVATVGQFAVLVSDENGTINSGDYITASHVNGIGMKAGRDQSVIVGKALDGFDGKDSVLSTTQIKNTDGSSRSVNIGRIAVEITVARNPLARSSNVAVPGFLGEAAQSIAQKPVSAARIYIGSALFIATAVITFGILYAGVRSSIISIGRNPLSKRLILRGLLQVLLTSLIIFLTGIFGVYLLLKL